MSRNKEIVGLIEKFLQQPNVSESTINMSRIVPAGNGMKKRGGTAMPNPNPNIVRKINRLERKATHPDPKYYGSSLSTPQNQSVGIRDMKSNIYLQPQSEKTRKEMVKIYGGMANNIKNKLTKSDIKYITKGIFGGCLNCKDIDSDMFNELYGGVFSDIREEVKNLLKNRIVPVDEVEINNSIVPQNNPPFIRPTPFKSIYVPQTSGGVCIGGVLVGGLSVASKRLFDKSIVENLLEKGLGEKLGKMVSSALWKNKKSLTDLYPNFDFLDYSKILGNRLLKKKGGVFVGGVLVGGTGIAIKVLEDMIKKDFPSFNGGKIKRPLNNWLLALKEFNKNKDRYIVPKKGSADYKKVMRIKNRLDRE